MRVNLGRDETEGDPFQKGETAWILPLRSQQTLYAVHNSTYGRPANDWSSRGACALGLVIVFARASHC
jgi:hypothetical protein